MNVVAEETMVMERFSILHLVMSGGDEKVGVFRFQIAAVVVLCFFIIM